MRETFLMYGKGAGEMIIKFQKVLTLKKNCYFGNDPERLTELKPKNYKWKYALQKLMEFSKYRNMYIHYQSKQKWEDIQRKYSYEIEMKKAEVVFEMMMKLIDEDHKYFYDVVYTGDVKDLNRINSLVY